MATLLDLPTPPSPIARDRRQFEDRRENGGAAQKYTVGDRGRRRSGAGLSRMKARPPWPKIARTVQSGTTSAGSVVEQPRPHCRAQWRARRLHRRCRRSRAWPAPRRSMRRSVSGASCRSRGVPFAVKNLFDLKGRGDARRQQDQSRQSAGHRRRRAGRAAGSRRCRLRRGGEHGRYAYGFTGENAHDGPSRNPHNLDHMTGGSSGGSGAAVAGGLVPIRSPPTPMARSACRRRCVASSG